MNVPAPDISVNGRVASGMVSVLWNGKMGLNTKENGSWVVHGERDYFCTQKVKSMKGIGVTTRPKVMESTCTLMVPDMKASGWEIYNMDKGVSHGPMDLYSKDHTKKERKTDSDLTYGLMAPNMMANGKIMKSLVTASINGLTAESILVTGKAILWMNSECILGKTVECMRDFIKMTRNMDLESILGPIRNVMLDGGLMGNSMGLEYFFPVKESVDSVSGKTVKSLDG